MIGYPGDKNGESWLKHGNFTAVTSSRYEHDLDIIPGDSGAAAYHIDDQRSNGIQSSHWWDGVSGRRWNEVLRWDAVTHNFFAAYGNWPRS
jgi:V8-like Glu-specific endopeptidase